MSSLPAEIAALGKAAHAARGLEDLELLRHLKASTRLAEIVGRACLFIPSPWAWSAGVAALSYSLSVEAQLNHSIMHGAYVGLPGSGRYTPTAYETIAVPFQSKTWRDAHRIHHAQPSILGADPDTTHALFRVHETTRWRPWHVLNGILGAAVAFETWAFEYDAFLKSKKLRAAGDRGELWKFARYVFWQYMLFTVLAGPRWAHVLAACVMATVIRNLVFTALQTASSVGAAVSTKHASFSTRRFEPVAFLRLQLESSKNFVMTSRPWQILCGGLDRHIEHHLFPQLPPERLRAISDAVRALSARYDIDYVEYPSITASLRDSFSYLLRLGRNTGR